MTFLRFPVCGSPSFATDESFGIEPAAVPVTGRASALPAPISRIVGVAAEKEVVRSNAAWVVAAMAYTHTFGDRPMVKFPRDTMGEQGLPGYAKGSVVTLARRSPEPTAIRAINSPIESFCDRDAASLVRACVRAITAGGVSSPRVVRHPAGSADLGLGASLRVRGQAPILLTPLP